MEGEESLGMPRGGPIYLPNMIGPLTTVPDFHNSICSLLQDFESHLSLDSSSSSQHYDVSTDALRIYTDEELTDMAMKEAFGDDISDQNSLDQPSTDSCNVHHDQKEITKDSSSKAKPRIKRSKANNGASTDSSSKAKPKIKRMKTGKKGDEAYLVKVEELAKIKKMQDEEKATVRLHCLNKTCENDKGSTASSSEGFERMQSLRSMNNAGILVKSSDNYDPVDMRTPEVILCVEIYNSCKSKTQEFLVLGHQTLTKLKDAIHCLTDEVMKKTGQYDPSGYFFIEDIFYNDMRDPSTIDYSKPIIDWYWNSKDEVTKKWETIVAGDLVRKHKEISKEMKLKVPHLRAMDMHHMRFCDLQFRLGAGYLYCHQGDCKHMIVIRDMRLMHHEDNHNRAVYPRLIFQQKMRVRKCSVCKIYRATKMTMDDKWAKKNPSYFCNNCFLFLHSKEGPLCCDFPVYDYLHE